MPDEYGRTSISGSQFLVRLVIVAVIVGAVVFFATRKDAEKPESPEVGLENRHDYLSVVYREGTRTREKAKEINLQREQDIKEAEKFDKPAAPKP